MADENNDSRRRNAAFRALLRTLCAIAIGWSAMAYVVYWAFFEREHTEWSEDVRLWDGRTLAIEQTSSQRVYHGHPHLFGWGGGYPWGSVTFESGGKTYQWEGMYIPIAIQLDESGVYLVVYDRETIVDPKTGVHESFRIYKVSSPSKWEEIAPAKFPRHLAIQNTWLRKNNGIQMDGKVLNEYEVVAQMDPSFYWFRDSLTAKLWSYLENADFNFDATPSEDFVKQYKAKWIRAPGNK